MYPRAALARILPVDHLLEGLEFVLCGIQVHVKFVAILLLRFNDSYGMVGPPRIRSSLLFVCVYIRLSIALFDNALVHWDVCSFE